MTYHAACATQDTISANLRTTRNGSTSANYAVCTNVAVMADLHLIVDLHAILDYRILDRTAINGCTGTDIDIIANQDSSELLDFNAALTIKRKTKPIGTNDRMAVYVDPRSYSDSVIDSHLSMQPAVLTQTHTTPNDGAGAN